jgi:hypothetical protein
MNKIIFFLNNETNTGTVPNRYGKQKYSFIYSKNIRILFKTKTLQDKYNFLLKELQGSVQHNPC